MGAQPAVGTRPRGAARPEPVRQPEFAHLTLEALRTYRTALGHEESRVSYWRRIVQARLDLVRAGEDGAGLEHLRDVLVQASAGTGRTALVDIVPIDDVPPLPDLGELWDRFPVAGDAVWNARLEADLTEAESRLSAYRAALHRRLSSATQELVARYKDEPALALLALPLRPEARRRATA
ncbi:MAG: hypothetical protein QOK42_539 [Frankiaceae bacterium]|jgi:hypothetical protein|nr:hypothetical protein [Frankiaceae bacterium]MDX6223660.1 hypothetical protein [Frankiales bacterium]